MLIVLLLRKIFWFMIITLSVTSSAGAGEYTTSLRSEKYSAKQNRHSIPSLASLFNVVTYWDKNNSSSPCLHTGKKRDLECTKVITFDRAGYDKSIEDMKKLILSRLNLEHEPSIKVNQKTMRFIDQLENRVLADGDQSDDLMTSKQQPAVLKTKYDMKTPENRVFNVMHQATHISVNCLGENDIDASLCINFEIPLKNFMNRDMSIRSLVSADLWVYLKSRGARPWMSSSSSNGNEMTIELVNYHHVNRVALLSSRSLAFGDWTTIDLTPLFVFPTIDASRLKHATLNFTLLMRCVVGCQRLAVMSNNDDSAAPSNGGGDDSSSSSTNTLDDARRDDDTTGDVVVVVENRAGKKPLLSLNIEEKEEILSAAASEASRLASSKRAKRKINGHQDGNYKAKGLDKNKYSPKMCHNNYPDAERECCLVTYYVSFTSLKWASWIISPSGFVANYCSGKCYDKTSFEYASHNAEVKMEYNEKLLAKEKFDANEMLETCCHPISMESLVIKYMANNGSLVSTVVPNMIISGCGCS